MEFFITGLFMSLHLFAAQSLVVQDAHRGEISFEITAGQLTATATPNPAYFAHWILPPKRTPTPVTYRKCDELAPLIATQVLNIDSKIFAVVREAGDSPPYISYVMRIDARIGAWPGTLDVAMPPVAFASAGACAEFASKVMNSNLELFSIVGCGIVGTTYSWKLLMAWKDLWTYASPIRLDGELVRAEPLRNSRVVDLMVNRASAGPNEVPHSLRDLMRKCSNALML